VLPGQTWPVLLRDTSRLNALPFCSGAPSAFCVQQSPVYPIAASLSNSVNIFDPNFEVAHSNTWTLGVQRALSSNMALEIRYVGTRNKDAITTTNLNELVIVQNGFFNEFRMAQANLQANIAAGRGATFAYFGPGTGTSPLPIYLANFNGKAASLAGDPKQYTGANWTNTTQVSQVGMILAGAIPTSGGIPTSPTGTPVQIAAASLQSNATFRTNMLAAGLPANFWVMNPDVSQANLTQSNGASKYDALQIELRRRASHGFFIGGNYTLATRFATVTPTITTSATTGNGYSIGQPLQLVQDPAGVTHALKANWGWDIPVGHGRHFGDGMPEWLNAIVGGWDFDGVARIQSGNLFSFGNVKLIGMTPEELESAFHIDIRSNPTTGVTTVYTLPQDIIDNTIRAFNVSATSSTGYAGAPPTGRYLAPANDASCLQAVRGDCAPADLFVHGPIFSRVDISTRKTFGLGGKRNFQFQVDIFNVFNAIGFNAVAQANNNATIDQVTTAYQDISNTFDPGGRVGQLMFRVNW
jgi:hypothetical protein